MLEVKLQKSWLDVLSDEFEKPYMQKLTTFIEGQVVKGNKVYPKNSDIFAALNSTSIDEVKVVILGQDPYHGENQANGLCFSVNKNIKTPPSLKNIYRELHDDIGFSIPDHGCLKVWAKQGVLLLNSVLTVNESQAGSHQQKGWEIFTDRVITELKQKKGIVYMLWGNYAHKKGIKINMEENLVLKEVHPSPLSAYRGFFGCKHFSKCNYYLEQQGKKVINWAL